MVVPNPIAKIQKISVSHEEYSENQRKHYVKLHFYGGEKLCVLQGHSVYCVLVKESRPLLQYLPILEKRGIKCYIQYSLNDYEAEGLEKNVPSLSQRIETFK